MKRIKYIIENEYVEGIRLVEKWAPATSVADLKLGKTFRLTAEQKVLVALDLNGELSMTELGKKADLAWGHLHTTIKGMLKSKKIECDKKNKTYNLTDEFKSFAKFLRYALDGWNEKDITVGQAVSDAQIQEYSGKKFHDGLKTIMELILTELPEVRHSPHTKILNIEEDPCFDKSPLPPEHWFYCHGISTKLQAEFGKDVVMKWVEKCNERGIGEVVINDASFAEKSTWEHMVPLASHEYWLTLEPPRPEGYIVFGDKVALLSWDKKYCVLYSDKNLARVFRNNIKILRLGGTIAPRCCADHKQFRANPSANLYKNMWE